MENLREILMDRIEFIKGELDSGKLDEKTEKMYAAELSDLAERVTEYDKVAGDTVIKFRSQELEMRKSPTNWKFVLSQIAIATVPLLIQILGYERAQNKAIRFEETGTFRSSVGKSVHLPKFWK